LIDNLVTALYGSITKQVVNGRVQWTIPCDPNNTATINNIPRNAGEGLLCYIIRALNLTGASGFVTANGVQTLSNKTLDASCSFLGNATTATSASKLLGGLAGSLPYQTGAGVTTFLAQGTAGQVLSCNGSGQLGWITSSTTSSSTNNVNGGTSGVVVYQTGVNTTGFTAAGTSGQVLVSNGTSAPTWSTNISGQAGSVADFSVSPAKLTTGGPSWDSSGNLTATSFIGNLTGTASAIADGSVSTTAKLANGIVTAAKLGTNEQKQIAKAWARFDGSGTGSGSVSPNSFGISSISRTATGTFTVNLNTGAVADVYYSVVTSGGVGSSRPIVYAISSQTISSFVLTSYDCTNGTLSTREGSPFTCIAIFD
jgi:hypothetical protein